MNNNIIGTELTVDELSQVHGGKGVVQFVLDAGKWVVQHYNEIKTVAKAAKKVWDKITSWF